MQRPDDTNNLTRNAIVSAAEWFDFQQMTEAEQTSWLDRKWAALHDEEPGDWEIAEGAGPTLVDIREYVGEGPDAVEQIVTVEATATWPPRWMVG